MNKGKQLKQQTSNNGKELDEQQEYKIYAQRQQIDYCKCMDFSKRNSLLISQSRTLIKVLHIRQGWLNQLKILSSHKMFLTTITIIDKPNQIISTSEEGKLHIWSMIPIAKPIIIKKFDDSLGYISCLIYVKSCDLIITSNYNYITFWKNTIEWNLIQSIADHDGAVWGLSLNKDENKLVSCGWGRLLLIIGKLPNEKWAVLQKIVVKQFGYRLCFLDNDHFVFQPRFQKNMTLFTITDNCNQIDRQEIELQNSAGECDAFFPMYYNQQRKYLLNKNGCSINILQIKEKGEIKTKQIINHLTYHIYGKMSDDGLLIATWDDTSKKILIRKCCSSTFE